MKHVQDHLPASTGWIRGLEKAASRHCRRDHRMVVYVQLRATIEVREVWSWQLAAADFTSNIALPALVQAHTPKIARCLEL